MSRVTLVARDVVAAAALTLVAAALSVAQEPAATLGVRVLDRATGAPVAGAVVRIGADRVERVTSADGRVRFDGLPSGTHALRVEALGYAALGRLVTLDAGAVHDVVVRLRPEPIALDSIRAEAPRRSAQLEIVGFYERRRLGHGTHLTGSELRERTAGSLRLTSALQTIPGLRVVRGEIVESSRGLLTIDPNRRCLPRFWLNGTRLPANEARRGVNRLVGLQEIAAIEVYAGPAQVPPQFGGTGAVCGVILIWTGAGER